MMKMLRTSSTLGLLSMLVMVACNDDLNGPGLDAMLNEDAALVAADAALEDLLAMNGGFSVSTAPALLSSAPPREVSRSLTFFDVDGNAQDGYDPDLTASINMVSDMSGEVSRDTWTATITRHRDFTISGLLAEETTRIFNGTGSGTVQRSQHSDESGDRSYEMSTTSVITDVVRGVPRDVNPWPLSGTITRDISITIVNGRNGDVTRVRTVSITFDGTQHATLTVNGQTRQVDLAARDGSHPIRR